MKNEQNQRGNRRRAVVAAVEPVAECRSASGGVLPWSTHRISYDWETQEHRQHDP